MIIIEVEEHLSLMQLQEIFKYSLSWKKISKEKLIDKDYAWAGEHQ